MSPLRAPGAARRSAAIRAQTDEAVEQRRAARRELLQGRMARLDIIDTDRGRMTPAQVREAVSDVARIVHALIRAL